MSLYGTNLNISVKSSISFQIQKKQISMRSIKIMQNKWQGEKTNFKKKKKKQKNSETNLSKQAALRFKRNLNLMPLIIEKLF